MAEAFGGERLQSDPQVLPEVTRESKFRGLKLV
jgi:hypothetical protein